MNDEQPNEISETLHRLGIPSLYDSQPQALAVETELHEARAAADADEPDSMRRCTNAEAAWAKTLDAYVWDCIWTDRENRDGVKEPAPLGL